MPGHMQEHLRHVGILTVNPCIDGMEKTRVLDKMQTLKA